VVERDFLKICGLTDGDCAVPRSEILSWGLKTDDVGAGHWCPRPHKIYFEKMVYKSLCCRTTRTEDTANQSEATYHITNTPCFVVIRVYVFPLRCVVTVTQYLATFS
jgi:hypothetical protein